ncbi:TPA: alpha/beta family hydrolase [Photobacterium damselae]
MSSEYLICGPESSDAVATFLFAHGAGAGMDHEFMTEMATELAKYRIQVIRFNFPYMVKRAEDGKKRPPDRQPKLLHDFKQHIDAVDNGKLVIGGKSMGGRMASLMVTDTTTQAANIANCCDIVKGVACLGFPFHPPGKPDNFRGDHFANMQTPTLILQGERDTFGTRPEVEAMVFSSHVSIQYLPDGDHSFKPRKASGYTLQQNMAQAANGLAQFIYQCVGACWNPLQNEEQ